MIRRLGLLATLSLLSLATFAPFGAPIRAATRAQVAASWAPVIKLDHVLDLSAQRHSGGIVINATSGLWGMLPGTVPSPFAPNYVNPGGDEPYMVMSPMRSRQGCSFGDETIYVLRLVDPTGVTAIDRSGNVRQFATIPGPGFESGIAFDQTGHFGHRLLVTVTHGIESALYAIDCHGGVTALAEHMPKVEGGIVVAPPRFGRFGGHLIAADEVSGHIYATPPDGRSEVLATLPSGGLDSGPETVGFVPPRFGPRWRALVADRVEPFHPPPGDGAILGIGGAQLIDAGVRPGDLMVATEAGAYTDVIRCRKGCFARHVADGPSTAHVEGHITFVRWRRAAG